MPCIIDCRTVPLRRHDTFHLYELLAPLLALLKIAQLRICLPATNEPASDGITVNFTQRVLVSLDCPLRRVQLRPVDLGGSQS